MCAPLRLSDTTILIKMSCEIQSFDLDKFRHIVSKQYPLSDRLVIFFKNKTKTTQQVFQQDLFSMNHNDWKWLYFCLPAFLCGLVKLLEFSNSCNNSACSVSFTSFMQVFCHKLLICRIRLDIVMPNI